MGLMILGRLKYIQQSHWCLSRATLRLRCLLKSEKRHKSPGIDRIPVQLIKAGGRIICSEVHKLINYIWNKEELPEQWKDSIILPVYK